MQLIKLYTSMRKEGHTFNGFVAIEIADEILPMEFHIDHRCHSSFQLETSTIRNHPTASLMVQEI